MAKSKDGKTYRRNTCLKCRYIRKDDDLDFEIDISAFTAIHHPEGTEAQAELAPSGNMQRVLFIPDTHRPYHDVRKWALLLKAGRMFKPDILVVLGDFADFYAVSSHDKDPSRKLSLRDELEDVRTGIKELESLGAKENIFICGNHEDRYDRYIAQKAPELHNLISIRTALGLDEWTFIPYKRHFNLGKLHITHDAGNAGGDAHKKAQATFEGNVIIGHTHRLAYTVVGNAEGQPHLGAMFGWLGDINAVDYMHRISVLRNWAHGFGIGYLLPNGTVHVSPIPIINNQVLIEGKLVS